MRAKIINQTTGRHAFSFFKGFYTNGCFIPVHPESNFNQVTQPAAFNNFFGR